MSRKEHYSVLGLSAPLHAQYGSHAIKLAYRKALLVHHPDKVPPNVRPSLKNNPPDPLPTIDDISLAYKVLSDPRSRGEYDRQLLLQPHNALRRGGKEIFHSGLDTVDLDDLDFDEVNNVWTRACRCGQERGFVVTEQELEKEMENGELCTGCRGCSLWLGVLFEANPGDQQNDEASTEVRSNG